MLAEYSMDEHIKLHQVQLLYGDNNTAGFSGIKHSN